MVVPATMDFFQHRYYRLNRIVMMLIGQWPYQSSRAGRCFRAIAIYANSSEIISRILDIVKNRNDTSILLDCAVPFFINLCSMINLIGFMVNSQKTLQLLNRIRVDWQVWAQHGEINILHEYAEHGRKINTMITATVFFTIFVNVVQLIVSKIIDVTLKNGTEPGKFLSPVSYYNIDTQRYYFYIMMYFCLMFSITTTIILTNWVMLVSHVQHASGIFSALGHKIELIGNNNTAIEFGETACAPEKRDMIRLAWCIERHNDVIEYATLIEAINSWNIFSLMAVGMVLINIAGVQILLSTKDPEAIMKFILVVSCEIILFFTICYVSQRLLDHSIDIRFCIYNSQWYRLPVKAQMLLQLMIMRCNTLCQLTAGKMMTLSIRNFGLTMRTAASYFTIVCSTQGL